MRFNHLCSDAGVSRRQALKAGAAGVGFTLGSGLAPLPPIFAGMADAVAATPGKILVVFEWFGGFDGLNTVIPYGDDAYYKQRPNLAYKEKDALKLGDNMHGLQKSMIGMKKMWDEGQMAVIHGVGYEQPSFSHFSSISYWHTGAPNSGDPFGWFGRVADAIDPAGSPNFLVNVSTSQTLAVRADKHVPVVFIDPNAFARDFYAQERPVIQTLGTGTAVSDTHKYLMDITKSAQSASALVGEAWQKYGRTRNPDLNLRDLDRVAALIEADFPARLYYVPLRGSLFDTHVNQQSPHDRMVQYNSDAIWGFYQEMKRIGKDKDVAMFVHSEFGRRVPENTSLGTDHGAGNTAFVLGGGIKGGFYGEKMSLTNLVLDDNLQYTVDFRRVYATLIEEFLGYKQSEKVLQGVKYKTLGMWA